MEGSRPSRRRQITLMNVRAAELVADGQPLHMPGDNVLVDLEDPSDPIRVIDLPQAVDARFNPNARDMLAHDVATCYRYFEKLGVRDNPNNFTAELWRKWKRAEL